MSSDAAFVPAYSRKSPGWVAQALCVLQKDVAIELSTGEVVVTSGFFALLIVIIPVGTR